MGVKKVAKCWKREEVKMCKAEVEHPAGAADVFKTPGTAAAEATNKRFYGHA